tara:strand:- start:114 stop:422 length:309 start_codon:yes stop_codon:yes gene_type:complete
VVTAVLVTAPILDDERTPHAARDACHGVVLVRREDQRVSRSKVVRNHAAAGLQRAQGAAREAVVEHHVDGHDRAVVEVARVVEGAAGSTLMQLYAARLKATQ